VLKIARNTVAIRLSFIIHFALNPALNSASEFSRAREIVSDAIPAIKARGEKKKRGPLLLPADAVESQPRCRENGLCMRRGDEYYVTFPNTRETLTAAYRRIQLINNSTSLRRLR